ncbi:MAG TPA: GNAT family N-acetyltransferase [Casimicrobiaceae bacterium]|nr:GNAT family N-acetyltransferase [Casimicrobiaceae bacterium]
MASVACNDRQEAEARRLEERSLNASGPFQSLLYDGWLLGYRRGPTKRLRCVNPFYASTLALAEKVDYCSRFYASVGLPTIFRMLPFSRPAELDSWLERADWEPFERTMVQRTALDEVRLPPSAAADVAIMPVADWQEPASRILQIAPELLPQHVERARLHPLPHAGALLRHDGEVVACGLAKIEGDHAGLFAITTVESGRGRGYGRAIVAALLSEAMRQGARIAYLQVTSSNVAALALYRRFGFTTAYEYWYRGKPGEHA